MKEDRVYSLKKGYKVTALLMAGLLALTACGKEQGEEKSEETVTVESLDSDIEIVPFSEVLSDLPDLSSEGDSVEEKPVESFVQKFEGDEQLVYQALQTEDAHKLQSPAEFFIYQIVVPEREEKGDELNLYAVVHAETFLINGKTASPAQIFNYPVRVTYSKKGEEYTDPKLQYAKEDAEVMESVQQVAGDNAKAKDALMAVFDDGMRDKEFIKVRDEVLNEKGLTLQEQ